jgi:hypothetical protein
MSAGHGRAAEVALPALLVAVCEASMKLSLRARRAGGAALPELAISTEPATSYAPHPVSDTIFPAVTGRADKDAQP